MENGHYGMVDNWNGMPGGFEPIAIKKPRGRASMAYAMVYPGILGMLEARDTRIGAVLFRYAMETVGHEGLVGFNLLALEEWSHVSRIVDVLWPRDSESPMLILVIFPIEYLITSRHHHIKRKTPRVVGHLDLWQALSQDSATLVALFCWQTSITIEGCTQLLCLHILVQVARRDRVVLRPVLGIRKLVLEGANDASDCRALWGLW
jgi:hypothetical protein